MGHLMNDGAGHLLRRDGHLQNSDDADCCCDGVCPDCADLPDPVYCDVTNCGVTETVTLNEIAPPSCANPCRVWEGTLMLDSGSTVKIKFACCEGYTHPNCFLFTYDACTGTYVGTTCPAEAHGWVIYAAGSNVQQGPPSPCGCPFEAMFFYFYWR